VLVEEAVCWLGRFSGLDLAVAPRQGVSATPPSALAYEEGEVLGFTRNFRRPAWLDMKRMKHESTA
jgi:hypothetical protein